MIQAKIQGVIMAINSLAGSIPPEAWEVLKKARAELFDAADMADVLENTPLEELGHRGGQAAGEAANG